MRTKIIAGTILMVAGCSGSAETPQAAQMTEETAAAELMHGLLDRASLNDRWFEQTSASPAVFKVGLVNPKEASDATVTVTRVDKCKYVTRFELSKTEIAEFSVALSGLDVEKLGPGNSMESRKLGGATVECKSEIGDRLCKIFHDGDVPSLMPAPKDRFKRLATEFKTKYCS